MSVSWTYLTRRFLLMNYRDMLAVGIVGSYAFGSYLQSIAKDEDNRWILQRVYTHDESDI